MLRNTKATFLQMDPQPLFSSNFHIFLPPKPPLSLKISRPLIQRVTWLLLTFTTESPGFCQICYLAISSLLARRCGFNRENQADIHNSQTDMTGHNFTYDRTQPARANHLNIPDGRNSGLSSRQQPSGYGNLLRGNFDPLIPKPNVKKFEGDPQDYCAFYNRFRCHVAD